MTSIYCLFSSGLFLFICVKTLDPSESLTLSGVLSTTTIICFLLRTRISNTSCERKTRWAATFERMESILFSGACIAVAPVFASEFGRLIYVKYIELFSPQPYNVMEGVEAVKTALLANGNNIYTNCSSYQYLVTIYPPIYYIFSSLILPIFNDALISNRILSASASIGLLLSIYLISLRITRSHLVTTTISLIILLSPALGPWLVLGRPDMLVWCFAFLSIYLAAYPRSSGPALMSGTSAALSVLVKQQALPVFLANALFLITAKRKRDFTIYLLVSLTIFASTTIIAQYLSNGMFLNNTFTYPRLYSESGEYVNKWLKILHFKENFLRDYTFIFITTVLSIWADIHNRRISIFCICFIMSLSSLYLLLGTWGFATNYILLTVIIMYLIILNSIKNNIHDNKAIISVFIVLFISTNTQYLGNSLFDYADSENPIRKELSVYKEEIAKAEYLLSLTESKILSDTDSGFFLTNKPYFKNINFFDGNHMTLYTKLFHYDFNSSQLTKDIIAKKFDYILLYPGAVHPRHILETIHTTYSPIIDGKYVTMYFIPK